MNPDIQTLDIIIPTYRPGEKFLRLFAMLQKQTQPYGHLIIMNTERELMPEKIRQMLSSEGRTILEDLRAEDFDHAATRARAVSLSHADAFVCMTDDAVPADEFLLERLLKSLREEGTAIAYARQLAAEDADEAEKYTRTFNYPEGSRRKTIDDLKELGIKTYFASNVCCAYRRSVYDELGGFTKEAIFNEDMIYACAALQKGYASVYAADARVIHSHNYTALQQFHRNFDLGMSQTMHPEVFGGLRSEGEGIRLVKNTVRHLARTGHAAEIPRFVVRTAFRYAGFRAGKAYEKLPDGTVHAFAMNKRAAKRITEARGKKRQEA